MIKGRDVNQLCSDTLTLIHRRLSSYQGKFEPVESSEISSNRRGVELSEFESADSE